MEISPLHNQFLLISTTILADEAEGGNSLFSKKFREVIIGILGIDNAERVQRPTLARNLLTNDEKRTEYLERILAKSDDSNLFENIAILYFLDKPNEYQQLIKSYEIYQNELSEDPDFLIREVDEAEKFIQLNQEADVFYSDGKNAEKTFEPFEEINNLLVCIRLAIKNLSESITTYQGAEVDQDPSEKINTLDRTMSIARDVIKSIN